MDFRTDLALERYDFLGDEALSGVEKYVGESEKTKVTEIRVTNEEGEKALGKRCGRYITVEVPPFSSDGELLDGRLDALVDSFKSVIPKDGTVLVAGLGNRSMTADALGPECADRIFVTRHIGSELAAALGLENLRSVAAFAPGVLGKTGIEASELISGVASVVKPSCIIAVDALAAMDLKRLGNTVQISDTGISPGSGVGNKRKEISDRTLGVPVIAVGVPTVISAYTVAQNVIEESKADIDISDSSRYAEYIVASREADLITERASRLISLAVNIALQPSLSAEEIMTIA